MSDTLCTSGFKVVVSKLEQMEIDATKLLAESGLSQQEIDDINHRIPVSIEARFWRNLADLLNHPNVGLLCSQFAKIGIYPMVDYLAASAATVNDSIKMSFRYIQLINEAWEPKAVLTGNDYLVFADVRCDDPGFFHSVEFGMGLILGRIKELSGKELTPLYVHFQHERPDNALGYFEAFAVEPVFQQERNVIALQSEVASFPCLGANAMLEESLNDTARRALAVLQDGCTGNNLIEQVKVSIRKQLADGEPALKFAAKDLTMSERTLQRRLREEGTAFATLMGDVRKEMAEHLIKDRTLPLIEIGFLLGYANTTAFYRAFKAWFQITPSEYRKTFKD